MSFRNFPSGCVKQPRKVFASKITYHALSQGLSHRVARCPTRARSLSLALGVYTCFSSLFFCLRASEIRSHKTEDCSSGCDTGRRVSHQSDLLRWNSSFHGAIPERLGVPSILAVGLQFPWPDRPTDSGSCLDI